MELLNTCFEGAEYVELIPEHEDNGGSPALKRGGSRVLRAKKERPPRKLPEILAALGLTVGAMVIGGGIGQQLWVLFRFQTTGWCTGIPDMNSLGLDAAHLGKAAQAVYCNSLRDDPTIENVMVIVTALVLGPASLRIAFGRAYFVSWNEEEEMQELQRLYRIRAPGERFVLASWRFRTVGFFVADILVWMWFRYYLDLYLDVQAMQIFYEQKEWGFLYSNLGGIVLGLVWTAVEFYKMLRESEGSDGSTLPGYQVLIVGLLMPLGGAHVMYLSVLSLIMGQKHRFLFISTLAESILESAVSAFVQTYAVIFSDNLDFNDKADLYASIALSFISIGYAFASLDRYDGGELLVQMPGLCRNTSWVWWAVFLFRVCECVLRGWAIAYVVVGDSVLMVALAAMHQLARSRSLGWTLLKSNIFYALPSSICLMTPMLEKDSPLAIRPEVYYVLRAVELVGMFVLCGRHLSWDVDKARGIFMNDALMVSTFCWSTLLMVALGLWLRAFVATRTLLEAPVTMWSMRAFTPTQQCLRDRILNGPRPRPDDQRKILAKIRSSPQRPSWEHRADLATQVPACSSSEEWSAGFLTARLSYCMEEALGALEETFQASTEASLSKSGNSGAKLKQSGSMRRLASIGAPTTWQHEEQAHGPLRTGALVTIRTGGSGLTAADGKIAMRWAGNQLDQKFVLEAASEEDDLGDCLMAGSSLRLRSLERGRFLRVDDGASDEADEEAPGLELEPDREMPLVEDAEVATAFNVALCHEEEYRSARRLVLHVRPTPGSLEIASLTPTASSETSVPRDWVKTGWRIALINGEVATQELLEEVLEAAQQEAGEDAQTPKSNGARPGSKPSSGSLHRRASFGRLKSQATSTHLGDDKFRVVYEKALGEDMPIHYGDKVILRITREFSSVGEPVGLGCPLQRAQTGLELGQGSRALVAAREIDPCLLTIGQADVGSHDDPPLYNWAAEEVRRRAQANVVRASLSEKCRVAMVVAFNAHCTGFGWALDQELHLRMMRLLASLVRGTREMEVLLGDREEVMEELRLGPSDASLPLVVQAVDADDGSASHAGVQAGDEVIELEVDRGGNRDCVLRGAKEIRRGLGVGLAPDEPRPAAGQGLTLVFRSPVRVPVDSGIQKLLVGQASIVAQIMPSWEDILAPLPELRRGQTPTRWPVASAQLLRHNQFFRLKCTLVTSLLQQGWEMKYAAFADSAMTLHEHFQVLTREGFRARLPGKDDASRQLCQDLLVVQLDVLTASWAAIPKAVKEHQPAVLRKLFRHDVELVAMYDAVDIVYRLWRRQTQATSAIVEMPGELQRFMERVKPSHFMDADSTAWIRQAWFGVEHKDEFNAVQKILDHFAEIYVDTEQYWMTKLDGAAQNMETAQEHLERALDSADMRVALVPADKMMKELKRIQGILSPDKLVLKKDLKVGDSDEVPKGMRLLRRGQISEHFGSDMGNHEVHRRLAEISPGDGTDLRLLFGGDDYDKARAEAFQATEDLGNMIRVVKTAAAAFPDSVAVQCQELLDKHHKGEMRAVLQENKRRIQVQQKEAQEMVRTANIKLTMAEDQKRSAVEKLREAEEERSMAEAAKKEAIERADAWWQNLQDISKEKHKLESDKQTLEQAMVAVERDKDRLENEKIEWTKAQSLMEMEKNQLNKDITHARQEAKSLEASAEKWHRTLQTVKKEAQEKEAHLREIQNVLQAHQAVHSPRRVASTPTVQPSSDAASPATVPGAAEAGVMPQQSEQAPPMNTTAATQDPGLAGEAFSQLLTILSRALNNQPLVERQPSLLSGRSHRSHNPNERAQP